MSGKIRGKVSFYKVRELSGNLEIDQGKIEVGSINLEDLYYLSRISLNSFVFTIRRQLVDGKPEPTLVPT